MAVRLSVLCADHQDESWYSFLLEAESTTGQLKNPIHLIGNRTRKLPARSTVHAVLHVVAPQQHNQGHQGLQPGVQCQSLWVEFNYPATQKFLSALYELHSAVKLFCNKIRRSIDSIYRACRNKRSEPTGNDTHSKSPLIVQNIHKIFMLKVDSSSYLNKNPHLCFSTVICNASKIYH
jgi:hypothetical protein